MLLLSCECWEHVALHLSWKDAFENYVSSVAMARFSQGKRHRVKCEYIRIALAARDPPERKLTASEQRLRRLELADLFPAACLCSACQYQRWQQSTQFVRNGFGGEPAPSLVEFHNLAHRPSASNWGPSLMEASFTVATQPARDVPLQGVAVQFFSSVEPVQASSSV